MYIAELKAKNYLSLKNISLKFHPGLNVIIGQNNTGKSNILRAIASVLDARSDRAFDHRIPTAAPEEADLYSSGGERASSYVVAVKLMGGGRLLKNLGDNWPATLVQMKSRKYGQFSDECSVNIRHKIDVTGTQIMSEMHELWIYKRFGCFGPNFCIDLMTCDGHCFHWHQLQPKVVNMLFWPLIGLFAATCHIDGDRTKEKLHLILSDVLRTSIAMANIHSTDSPEKAAEIANGVFAKYSEAFSRGLVSPFVRSIDIGLKDFSFDPANHTIFGAEHLELRLTDGTTTSLKQKGDGVLSSLVIDSHVSWRQNANIILLDEPESSLHPHSQRSIMAGLSEFVKRNEVRNKIKPTRTGLAKIRSFKRKTGSRLSRVRQRNKVEFKKIAECDCREQTDFGGQLIVSTHSPVFLREAQLKNVTLVYKDLQGNQTRISRASETLSGFGESQWRQLTWTKNGEMFFADHVLLVEGGEEYLIPALADLYLGNGHLGTKNVSIVRVNGKGSFRAYYELLSGFGIAVSILTDIDFISDGLERFNWLFNQDFTNRLNKLKQQISNVKSSKQLKGRHVKSVLTESRDWLQLYSQIDTVINAIANNAEPSNQERLVIGESWGNIVSALDQKGAKEIMRDENNVVIRQLVTELIDQAKSKGIFILDIGELEDCYAFAPSGKTKEEKSMTITSRIRLLKTWKDVSSAIRNPKFFEEIFESLNAITK